MNTTLKTLSAKLDSIVNTHGEDACLAQADRVYSQELRTEAMGLIEYCNTMSDSQEEFYTNLPELCKELGLDMESVHTSTEKVLVCNLCNYKGEGEGVAVLFESVKDLPVFISKSQSFNI